MVNKKNGLIVTTDATGNVSISKEPQTVQTPSVPKSSLLDQDYTTLAQNYANNARQEYENSLSYLLGNVTNAYNVNKDTLTNEYNNLVDTLNNNYQGNARQAYVNKMLAGEALNEHLANLGISTQGFGVGQRLGVENTYATSLANLQNELQGNLTDADTNYQNNLAALYNNYQNNLTSVKSQIASGAQEVYADALNNYAGIYNQQLQKEQNQNANIIYSMIARQQAEDQARMANFNNNKSILGALIGRGNTLADKVANNNLKKSIAAYPEEMATKIAQYYNSGLINEEGVDMLLKSLGYTENTTKKK